MKKHVLLVWLLALALILVSCIQSPSELSEEPQPTPEETVPQTPLPPSIDTSPSQPDTPSDLPEEPTLPDLPSYPVWSADDSTAQRFLQTDGIVDVSRENYSYEEMAEDLSDLSALYPNRFSYRSFGKSVLGRDLYVATLGNPDAPKQILVSAGIHGREYMTPLLVMKQIEFCLAYYESGICSDLSFEELFDNVCFSIVPMTNPDGIMLAQGGLGTVSDQSVKDAIAAIHYSDFSEGLTKETTVNGFLKSWKANANGVDLNRNFDMLWEDYAGIDRPSHKNYKGPCAESEPETKAMVALTQSLSNIQAVLCIHSQGEVLYWNCGQGTQLKNETLQFTKMVAGLTGYYIVPERNNDASFSDWCALNNETIAITVETGVGACPLPISQFPTIWMQNYNLLARSARYFTPNT